MLSSLLGNSFLVIAVLVFVTLMLLFEGLYLMWQAVRGPQAAKLQKRLHALAASSDRTPQTQLLKQRLLSELPVLERGLQRLPRVRGLDRTILQSGLNWTVANLLLGSIAIAAVVWLVMTIGARQSMLASVILALGLGAAPTLYLYHTRSKRLARIERQLPDALDLISRALRAGHAFSAAVKMAGEEMAEPIGSEFSTVHDEINFGVSMQEALTHLSERVPITDLRYFVVAVLIQRDSGGNLTEILSNLSRLIRERLKLLARVKVLSSEGRMSAWILGLMPFFLGGAMYLVNPTFMSPLWTDPIGVAIIKYMLSLMLIGVVIMRKIIKIRF